MGELLEVEMLPGAIKNTGPEHRHKSLSSGPYPVNRNGLTAYGATNKMITLTYGRFSVIKQDIVNRVAEQLNITKVRAEIAVESVFNSLKNALKRGERIELRGFGVFIVKPRKSGVGRNPRTGEEVAIPPGKTIRFKPGKEIRADKIGIAE
jgi:DNA-binding protein HU-beta